MTAPNRAFIAISVRIMDLPEEGVEQGKVGRQKGCIMNAAF